MPHRKAPVSKSKARKILEEGIARGKKLSKRQKGFFGAIAGGTFGHPKRKRSSKHRKKRK